MMQFVYACLLAVIIPAAFEADVGILAAEFFDMRRPTSHRLAWCMVAVLHAAAVLLIFDRMCKWEDISFVNTFNDRFPPNDTVYDVHIVSKFTLVSLVWTLARLGLGIVWVITVIAFRILLLVASFQIRAILAVMVCYISLKIIVEYFS